MSNLLKMGLAMDSPTLKARVQSAVIQVAHQQQITEGSTGAFANLVLADVTRKYPDFMLDVAANPSIQEALVLTDDHAGVVSTLVSDDDILYVVNGTFPKVAAKITPQPEGEES